MMLAFKQQPDKMRSRRSTATVTLVLIGAAALQACSREEDTATRDVYRSRADCQRDWGDDPQKCEPAGTGPHAGYFYGPLLYGLARGGTAANSAAPRPGSNAVGSTRVTRGGFGSSASAHSSGG